MSDSKKALVPVVLDPIGSIFVAEYVANGGNGTKAMMKARPELTDGSAATLAHKLLKNIEIRSEIEKALRAQVNRINERGDRVIAELFRILSADIKDAFTENGTLKSIHDIPEDLRRAIASFEVEEIWDYPEGDRTKPKIVVGELKKVKFWSKTESANLLGKHLKLWVEQAGLSVDLFVDGDVVVTLDIKT